MWPEIAASGPVGAVAAIRMTGNVIVVNGGKLRRRSVLQLNTGTARCVPAALGPNRTVNLRHHARMSQPIGTQCRYHVVLQAEK